MRLAKLFNHQKLFEGASDYQAIIDNFPYDELVDITSLVLKTETDDSRSPETHLRDIFHNELKWAQENLKRSDRVIWWIKFIKACYYWHLLGKNKEKAGIFNSHPKFFINMVAKNSKFINDIKRSFNRIITFNAIKPHMAHYMGIDYHKIQNLHWTHQGVYELSSIFDDWEKEYQESEGRKLMPDASHTVILKMGDFVWLNLNKAACANEGNAGRHCGNSPREHTDDRILSLRRILKGDKQEVCLTFVLEDNGYLGERKAFANQNPDPKYHSYIIELLKQPFIKGLKDGRWETANDFRVTDLSPQLAKQLYNARPDLFSLLDAHKIFGLDSKEFEQILIEQSPKGIPNAMLAKIWPNTISDPVPVSVMQTTIEHGNHVFPLDLLKNSVGYDHPLVGKLRQLKMENLTEEYLKTLSSFDDRPAKDILQEALDKGYKTNIPIPVFVDVLGMDSNYVKEWIATHGKSFSAKEAISVFHTLKVNPVGFLVELIFQGNSNISWKTVSARTVTGDQRSLVQKMIENGSDMNPLTTMNIIRKFGKESPIVKRFVYGPKFTSEQILGEDIFSVLSQKEALEILKGEVPIPLMPHLTKYYGRDSAIVQHAITSSFIDLGILKSVYPEEDEDQLDLLDPENNVSKKDLYTNVKKALFQIFEENASSHTVETTDKYIILAKWDLEDVAEYTMKDNGGLAAKIISGNTNYFDYTNSDEVDLDYYDEYLIYDYDEKSARLVVAKKYDMHPVYAKYIRESKWDEWKDFTNSQKYYDYDEDDLTNGLFEVEDGVIIYPPEKERVKDLLKFLRDNDEEWDQAFNWSYNDAYEEAQKDGIIKGFYDTIDDWTDELVESKTEIFFTVKNTDYTPELIHDETFYPTIRLDHYLDNIKFKLRGIQAYIEGTTPDDDEISMDNLESFCDINSDEFYDFTNNLTKKDFHIDDRYEVDNSDVQKHFGHHMPVSLEYIIDAQPVKLTKK
jgi:hypothetical protein